MNLIFLWVYNCGMRIWALTNGTAGMRAQAAGLARALAGILQAEVLEKTVPLSAVDSPPEVAVACGGSAVWPALNLKRKFGSFAVFTQRPFFGESFFDAVLRPGHDGPGGKNSLAITGSVGPVSAEVLAARRASALARFGHPPPPRIGVLIGGANRAFSLSPEDCGRIRDSLFRARDELGGGGGGRFWRRRRVAPGRRIWRRCGREIFCKRTAAGIRIWTFWRRRTFWR